MVGAELEIALRSKRRVGSDSDAELLAKSNELLLGQVRVELDLVDGRLNASIAENVNEKSSRKVAESTESAQKSIYMLRFKNIPDTNVLGETSLRNFFHGLPRLTDGDLSWTRIQRTTCG